jgi:hypothetical protein
MRAQRSGRYVAGTAAHPARLSPDLAAMLIQAYSGPGDLVFDPLAGTGTVLVEAVHLGRNALGVAGDPGWLALARANVALAYRQGATGRARALAIDPARIPAGIPAELRGQVAFVLTCPPPAATLRFGAPPSAIRRRIGMVDGLAAALAGCVPLLSPDGFIAVVARPWYRATTLINLPGQVLDAGRIAGLGVVDTRRAVRIPQCYPDQLHTRIATDDGIVERDGTERTIVAHHDVTVFQPIDRRHLRRGQ